LPGKSAKRVFALKARQSIWKKAIYEDDVSAGQGVNAVFDGYARA